VTRAIEVCRADESIPNLDSLVVCGGVAANQQVRSRLLVLAEKMEIRTVFPPGASALLEHRATLEHHPTMTAFAQGARAPCGATCSTCSLFIYF
jgi:1,6-anhydro-N-acetylmuramate kinase